MFIAEKKEVVIPNICDDESDIEIISHSTDLISDRSFKDNIDSTSHFQFHTIYLVPCEREDRKFDVNKNIHYSLETINKWLLDKTNNQIINYDRINEGIIDTTFIRVNKTLNWFTQFRTKENHKQDASSKIEDIILSNFSLFHNFNKKNLIVDIPESIHNLILSFIHYDKCDKCDIPYHKVYYLKNRGDIFDKIFEYEIFDFVWCNGVLHHTKNPYEAFKNIIPWLKKNGYIFVGLYNKIGRFRTKFRKYIYKFFGKEILIKLDPVLRNIPKKN